jgi:cadmium resistance protein CadD (predicted permease)
VDFLGLIGFGICAFAAANIDDIFVLMAFFSDPNYKVRLSILHQLSHYITPSSLWYF